MCGGSQWSASLEALTKPSRLHHAPSLALWASWLRDCSPAPIQRSSDVWEVGNSRSRLAGEFALKYGQDHRSSWCTSEWSIPEFALWAGRLFSLEAHHRNRLASDPNWSPKGKGSRCLLRRSPGPDALRDLDFPSLPMPNRTFLSTGPKFHVCS